jgi:uncharacterized repeat protein (TIGR01451 family)
MKIRNVAMLRQLAARAKSGIFHLTHSVKLTTHFSPGVKRCGVLVVFAAMGALALFSGPSAFSSYGPPHSNLTDSGKVSASKPNNLLMSDYLTAKLERSGALSAAELASGLMPSPMFTSSETIATVQCTDFATPKSVWNLGETACAAASGATGPRHIIWYAPNGHIAQIDNAYDSTDTDSYSIPSSGDFAQVGTWRVRIINSDGDGINTAEFVVRKLSVPSADLSLVNSGQAVVSVGDSIFYKVSVLNLGPDDAANVAVTNATPDNTTFVSVAQNSGSTSFACTGATCTGSLPANEKATFTYVYALGNGTPVGTIISDTASVTSTTNEPAAQRSDNSSTVQTTVTSVPSSSCTINCPSSITVETVECSAIVNYSTPVATGTCTDPETGTTDSVACSPPSGSAFPIGTTNVTCSAGGTDCSFTVTVNKTGGQGAPTITCPANITEPEASPGFGFRVVNYSTPTTTGNCVTTVCDPPSGSSFPVGATTVTCTATDLSDATATCSFTVTVTSNVCSSASLCPGNITARNDPGQCGATVNFPTPPDSCGTVTCTPASGSFFAVGTTTVNCSSSASPSSNCSFIVTVQDIQEPTINCPADIVVYLPLNSTTTSMAVTFPAVTATDNCPGTVPVTVDHASGSVFPVGTTTVMATATDAAGNTSTCTFDVTIRYNFTGFLPPLGNSPTVNRVNAGRAVPVKFSLSGDKGLNVFAPGYPVSFEVDCGGGVPLEVTETLSAGGSSVSYDPATDQYTYVWKTEALWAGTCRYLVVKLKDGTDHIVYFEFR